MRNIKLTALIDRFVTKFNQVWLTVKWTLQLSKDSTGVVVTFIVASVLNALTDGFTVLLVVPILSSSNAQNMFEGLPLLHQFGALFAGMEPNERLRWIAVLILVIVVLRGAIQYFVDIIIYVIPLAVDQSLRIRAFRTISASRMAFIDSIDIGELTNYTANFPARVGIAARFVAQMISSVLTVVFMLILLLTITPGVLLATGIFGFVASVAFKKLTGTLMIDVSRAVTVDQERFNRVYFEAIQNRKPIKIFRAGDLFALRIGETMDRLRRVQIKILALQAATYPFFSTFAGIVVCAGILAASVVQPERGQALLGLMIVCLVMLFRLIGPITSFHISRMYFVTHVEAIEGLYRFFQIAKAAEDRDGTISLERPKGYVEFANVSFSYDDGTPIFSDISFTAEPGQVVALVGPSGVGKSTILYLIARLYRPKAGRILVDGIDLDCIQIDSWRRGMSFVGQDAPIFQGTVRENISFGRNGSDQDDSYNEALEAAAAREFIGTLPDGLECVIGEGKRILSGGERQRIALARAFYARPQVILLDEATSQLDALAERQVRERILELRNRGCTVIAIAHRLSTIQDADKIIVMNRGEIDDTGSFDELIVRDGLFARMVKSQAFER